MGDSTGRALGAVAALLIATSACAASSKITIILDDAGQSLPALSVLDSLRAATEIDAFDADLSAPLTAVLTDYAEPHLNFNATATEMSYAVFRLPGPEGPLLTLRANGDAALWLLAADYSSGCWADAAQLNDSQAIINLGEGQNWKSPDGYCYAAVIGPVGSTGQLERVWIEYLETTHEPQTYFVDPIGNDSAAGSSEDPWLTIQHAADTVLPGDSVVVRAGDYSGFHINCLATEQAPVSFSADVGVVIQTSTGSQDGVRIQNSSFVVLQGFSVQNSSGRGIGVFESESVTIKGNQIEACEEFGIYAEFVSGLLIESNQCLNSELGQGIALLHEAEAVTLRGNYCAGNAAAGIRISGDPGLDGAGLIHGLMVERNELTGNGARSRPAIECYGVVGSLIINNLVYDNDWTGLLIGAAGDQANSANNTIANNTIVAPGGTNGCLFLQENCGTTSVYNNILIAEEGQASLRIDGSQLAELSSDHNVLSGTFKIGIAAYSLEEWQTETGQDANSLLSLPLEVFHDYANADFRLAQLSPAIDTAFADAAPLIDFAGVGRPLGAGYDRGAYEYVPPGD